VVVAELRDVAVAAPAAFLLGVIVGQIIKTRYKIVRSRNGNGNG
jgi:hypothetical protein